MVGIGVIWVALFPPANLTWNSTAVGTKTSMEVAARFSVTEEQFLFVDLAPMSPSVNCANFRQGSTVKVLGPEMVQLWHLRTMNLLLWAKAVGEHPVVVVAGVMDEATWPDMHR